MIESIIKQKCYDCGKDITFSADKIENGYLLTYDDSDEEIDVFKCDQCYEKNESLEYYKECEVYSRIVGYIRPVKDYNKGKAQEFKERKTFTR